LMTAIRFCSICALLSNTLRIFPSIGSMQCTRWLLLVNFDSCHCVFLLGSTSSTSHWAWLLWACFASVVVLRTRAPPVAKPFWHMSN
jgi:hypothetical protein